MPPMLRAVTLLIAPTLVVLGGVAALSVQVDQVDRQSRAEQAYLDVVDLAHSARDDTVRATLDLSRAIVEAKSFVRDASALSTTAVGFLEPSALAGLNAALEALRSGLPSYGSVPVLPESPASTEPEALAVASEELADWTPGITAAKDEAVDALAAVQALRRDAESALARAALTAESAGSGVLANGPMASQETKDGLAAAIAAVNARLGAGALATAELGAYFAAARAVQDGHAAAVAAATAAAATKQIENTASGGYTRGVLNIPVLAGVDLNNPPEVYFYGNYLGWSCPRDSAGWENYSLENGEVAEYWPGDDSIAYAGRTVPIVTNWALIIEYCA